MSFYPFQVTIILGGSAMTTYGYYNVIRCSFVFKIMLGMALYMTGPTPWMLIVFYLADRYELF